MTTLQYLYLHTDRMLVLPVDELMLVGGWCLDTNMSAVDTPDDIREVNHLEKL